MVQEDFDAEVNKSSKCKYSNSSVRTSTSSAKRVVNQSRSSKPRNECSRSEETANRSQCKKQDSNSTPALGVNRRPTSNNTFPRCRDARTVDTVKSINHSVRIHLSSNLTLERGGNTMGNLSQNKKSTTVSSKSACATRTAKTSFKASAGRNFLAFKDPIKSVSENKDISANSHRSGAKSKHPWASTKLDGSSTPLLKKSNLTRRNILGELNSSPEVTTPKGKESTVSRRVMPKKETSTPAPPQRRVQRSSNVSSKSQGSKTVTQPANTRGATATSKPAVTPKLPPKKGVTTTSQQSKIQRSSNAPARRNSVQPKVEGKASVKPLVLPTQTLKDKPTLVQRTRSILANVHGSKTSDQPKKKKRVTIRLLVAPTPPLKSEEVPPILEEAIIVEKTETDNVPPKSEEGTATNSFISEIPKENIGESASAPVTSEEDATEVASGADSPLTLPKQPPSFEDGVLKVIDDQNKPVPKCCRCEPVQNAVSEAPKNFSLLKPIIVRKITSIKESHLHKNILRWLEGWQFKRAEKWRK